MDSWLVYVKGVMPCGHTASHRLTHNLDEYGVLVGYAECPECGATWDEWDDIEYFQ